MSPPTATSPGVFYYLCAQDCVGSRSKLATKTAWIEHMEKHLEGHGWECRFPDCGKNYRVYGSYRNHVLDNAHHHDGDLVDLYRYRDGGPPELVEAMRRDGQVDEETEISLEGSGCDGVGLEDSGSEHAVTIPKARSTRTPPRTEGHHLQERHPDLRENSSSTTPAATSRVQSLTDEDTDDMEMSLRIREAKLKRALADIEVEKLELLQKKHIKTN